MKIPRAQVDRALRPLLGESILAVAVVSKTSTGRAKAVTVRGRKKQKTISGADLRRLLGYNTIWSTWIDAVRFEGGFLVVQGKGSGHGVGMCQWGARGLALEGRSAEQILERYYPGTRVMRLY